MAKNISIGIAHSLHEDSNYPGLTRLVVQGYNNWGGAGQKLPIALGPLTLPIQLE